LGSAGFIKNASAPATLQKTFAPLDRDEGNKEKAHVMIEPFEPGRGRTAVGTDPRLIIHFDFSWLNSADKKEEDPSPPFQD